LPSWFLARRPFWDIRQSCSSGHICVDVGCRARNFELDFQVFSDPYYDHAVAGLGHPVVFEPIVVRIDGVSSPDHVMKYLFQLCPAVCANSTYILGQEPVWLKLPESLYTVCVQWPEFSFETPSLTDN